MQSVVSARALAHRCLSNASTHSPPASAESSGGGGGTADAAAFFFVLSAGVENKSSVLPLVIAASGLEAAPALLRVVSTCANQQRGTGV